MNLPRSIVIHPSLSGSSVRLRDRLEVCDGVLPAEKLNDPGESNPYSAGAIVPSGRWRAPTEGEMETLTSNATNLRRSCDPGRTIGLVRLPASLVDAWTELGVGDVLTAEELRARMSGTGGQAIRSALVEHVRGFGGYDPAPRAVYGYVEPGRPMTGLDVRNGKLIGLHIDNSVGWPIERRHEAPNRISINIGREARHLLMINLTAQDLADAVDAAPGSHPDPVVREFLRAYPDYPVFKLRIEPGEAYIAPTDNLIHDGIGARMRADVQLVLHGRIGIPSVA